IEFLSHTIEPPAVILPVLYPLEIADGDAAGVCQYIWQHDRAALFEDFIGVWPSRSVSGFDDDLRFDAWCVGRRDHSTERRGNQQLNVQFQKLLVGDLFPVAVTRKLS